MLENLNLTQVQKALLLSLGTTLAATVLTILLGTPLAYGQARGIFRPSRLVDTIIDMPLVLPPAVAGIALLLVFGRRGVLSPILEPLDLQIAFTPIAVVLAQTFVAAPFYIKSAALGFANVDKEIVQAAGLDGASAWNNFKHITIPLSWTALLSGALMTWARALGEFGATIIFAGNLPGLTQTMPLAIYIGFELDLNIALTLSVILVAFSFTALMVVKAFLKREWP